MQLPMELAQQGWERCWSKRENRPYFFNRNTNESMWEMPMPKQHQVRKHTCSSACSSHVLFSPQ